MTKDQRIILIVLGVLNILCLCIIAPILLLNFGAPNTEAIVQPTTLTSLVLPPTSTVTLTPLPQPTNTYVLAYRPPSASAATVTPRTLESGWKFFQGTDASFGVALPASWDRVDFDRDRLSEMLKNLNGKNPQFASTLSAQSEQLATLNVKLFGFDLSNDALSSGFVTNVNVLQEPLAFTLPLETYAQLSVQNLEKSASITKPTRKGVTIPAGAAQVIQYQLSLTTASGKTTTSTTQYLLIHSNTAYIVTFTTRPDKEKTYAPVFQKIAQTLQWVP